jgi:hypothetical protein
MNKKRKYLDKHHVIPRSRGGDSSLENICYVGKREHELYHTLFSNKTPPEIVEYMVRVFWKDNWSYINEAQTRYRNDKMREYYKKQSKDVKVVGSRK